MVAARIIRKTHRKLNADPFAGQPKKVKVGFPKSKAKASNIEKAIWNEFGTSRGIPERPFMRNAMRDNRKKYKDRMAIEAKAILANMTTLRQVLARLGILAQGDIQHEITALQTPPNAPATIKRKGSSNPLIDTGEMRQAVTWIIDE